MAAMDTGMDTDQNVEEVEVEEHDDQKVDYEPRHLAQS